MAKTRPAQDGRDGERIVVASNRRARRDFDILDTVEAGVQLAGSEVKALRGGNVQLADAYAHIHRNEVFLHGVHIAPYEHASRQGGHDPDRIRKLLLHRGQIDRWAARMQQERLTIVPLDIHFSDGRAKVELALARGRRRYDKREAIKRREADLEARRQMARHGRR
jgi:SsrA-binding protein